LSRPKLYSIRFLMLVVVLAALSLLLAPRSDRPSPYLSALSTLSAPTTLAATCAMTSCGRDKEGRSICVPSGTPTNCKANRSGHSCSMTNC